MPASIASWPDGLALALAPLLLIYAALHDVAVRTIPDTVPAALAVLGLGVHLADHMLPAALLAATLLGIPLLLCWLRRWLGGGDVKLLVALALLLRPDHVVPAIVTVAGSGVLLALPYCALRHRIAAPPARRPAAFLARIWRAERFRLRRGGPLPYGLAIAAGGLLELIRR